MKVRIEIDCDTAAFNELGEMGRILKTVPRKVVNILLRDSACFCEAPEIDDKLIDINGNTVGKVEVIRD